MIITVQLIEPISWPQMNVETMNDGVSGGVVSICVHIIYSSIASNRVEVKMIKNNTI